jgi:hypothetical protein
MVVNAQKMGAIGTVLCIAAKTRRPDVRCCSKSDHSRRECELTLRANRRHRPPANFKVDISHEWVVEQVIFIKKRSWSI